jgi:hypothetical protein
LTTLKLDPVPFGGRVFIDGADRPALAGEIEKGPHQGIYIFTCKARAEEFGWKNGVDIEFVEEDAQCEST